MNKAQLQSSFPTLEFKEHVVLAPFTFMKVGGPAELFVSVHDRETLFELSSYCFTHDVPFVILGGASNTVIADEGLSGLVIHNQANHIDLGEKQGEHVLLHSDSGVITAHLSAFAAEHLLTGLEYFSGVPGTVGGAIVNNSHFTAKDLFGNYIVSVDVCTNEGKREVWQPDGLKFAYDYSVFHEVKAVVLGAVLKLALGDRSEIQEKVKAAALKRTTTQPIGIPSSGCMYRNPVISAEAWDALADIVEIPDGASRELPGGTYQVAAGFLIDRAGLKGKRIGDIAVSEKHATYMVNLGKGTTKDIESLCQLVEKTVNEKFGIHLEREVFFLS